MHLRLLRVFLGFAAIAWGASVFGVILPWPAAADALQGLGAQPIGYDRMLVEGLVLLTQGVRLGLPPLPFYADTAACIIGGTGILWSAARADYDGTARGNESCASTDGRTGGNHGTS